MMNIEATFFALYRERVGKRKHTVRIPKNSTVSEFISEIRLQFPLLAPPGANIVVAVNTEYADPRDILHEGDEVCLIPPVSGG
jgi:molybdopterin converting factor subunit 1